MEKGILSLSSFGYLIFKRGTQKLYKATNSKFNSPHQKFQSKYLHKTLEYSRVAQIKLTALWDSKHSP